MGTAPAMAKGTASVKPAGGASALAFIAKHPPPIYTCQCPMGQPVNFHHIGIGPLFVHVNARGFDLPRISISIHSHASKVGSPLSLTPSTLPPSNSHLLTTLRDDNVMRVGWPPNGHIAMPCCNI